MKKLNRDKMSRFENDELDKNSTSAKIAQVQIEGSRDMARDIKTSF